VNKTFNIQGRVTQYDYSDNQGSCNYTVDEDGIGTIFAVSHILETEVTIPFGVVVLERGQRVEFIRTDSIARGTALPQKLKIYNKRTIQGPYGYHSSGISASHIGRVDFDGVGGCKFDDIVYTELQQGIRRKSTSCTYVVYPNGLGNLLAEFSSDDGSEAIDTLPLEFVIVKGGEKILTTRADEYITGGELSRQ